MNDFLTSHAIQTLIVIAVAMMMKIAVIRFLKKKQQKESTDKRIYINNFKNLINLFMVIALFYVWHGELKEFAISIAAFVVAIVLATRELIQCFIGFVYLSGTTTFRIGDWIQVGPYTGEVTATDWAKITLLEVEPESYSYTGRTVFIPNSQLMIQPIKNLNFMRRYINHSFAIVKQDHKVNPYPIVAILKQKAVDYCQEFHDVAERYNQLIENRLGVKLPGPAPSVEISTTEIGHVKVMITVFCPTDLALNLQQKLTEDFFLLWTTLKDAQPERYLHDE